jgi:NAD(P)-dependent dehydrogenase (short-subunit alcohol dehydrogenase family)
MSHLVIYGAGKATLFYIGLHMEHDLSGKVFLLTGGTDGIGKAAATEFARRGADLTILARNEAKAERVVSELKMHTGNDRIRYLLCDLSRMADVRRAADEFKLRPDRLDVLVNNAGATLRNPMLGPDGIELTFALNYLSHFLLTLSLLDVIRGTKNARVVSTSSAMQARGTLDLNITPTSVDGPGWRAYATAKLATILFTMELQRRLAGSTATANCFEPGMVRTQFGGFGTDLGFFLNLVYAIARPFAKTPQQGADSLIWLATCPEARPLMGQYISQRRPAIPAKQARDPDLALQLWVMSEALCARALSPAG